MSLPAAPPQITILLSTYNGARFLAAQLASLAAQTYQSWVLYWRDDGSTDGTVAALRDFAAGAGAGRCVESPSSGPHLGAAASFLKLLAENLDAEVAAFADQDDVWLPEKLERAMARLNAGAKRAELYCARQYLVDEDLQRPTLSASHAKTIGFPACLAQNIATGNTLVMNAAAICLVASAGQPEGTMHDWWSYILVSACGGRIIFDDEPQLYYRMHAGNLVGAPRPVPARALAAIRRGPRLFMTLMHRNVAALAQQSSRLTPQAREDLRLVQAALAGGLTARLRALLCRRFRRRTLLENLLFWCWFLADGLFGPPVLASDASLPSANEARPTF